MYETQIACAADGNEDHGQQQDTNTERIGGHAVQSLRRDHRAERYADEYEYRAHQQRRDEHWPTGNGSAGDCQNRAR